MSPIMRAGPEVSREMLIVNQRGLHARASAKFVQLAAGYDADIAVARDGMQVGGTSIMGLMMLAASPGSVITVTATGPQAAEAVAAIEDLVRSRFGEES
jgi:phosphocarrier protein